MFWNWITFRLTLNKRKNSDLQEESNSIESKYKIKDYIKNDSTEKKVKKLALPIKTANGLLVKNARSYDSENEDEEPKMKKAAQYPEVPKSVETPKTFIEMIRDKKEAIEKNKEKIATYSKEVLQNPQEEVWINIILRNKKRTKLISKSK